MIKKKGQSAIEYLMTYGWMLLVVAVAGGAIFSVVGDQSIENVSGFNSQDVNVQDFGVSTQNGLMFSMNDPIGQTTITEVTVSNPDTANITYTFNQDISEQNTINLPGITPANNENQLEVEITYNSDNLENLITSGTITGNLEVDENYNNNTIIMDGLAGYWPLSKQYLEDDTVYDLTSNDNHGAMINNPAIADKGLEFDGEEDYIDSGYTHNSQDGALSFWVYLNNNSDFGFGAHAAASGGDSRLYVREEFPIGVGNNYNGGTFQPFEDEWHHIVLTFDEESATLYINTEVEDTLDSYSWGESSPPLHFGRVNGRSDWINGKIDDVRVYNRALSEDEIKTIYEQGETE